MCFRSRHRYNRDSSGGTDANGLGSPRVALQESGLRVLVACEFSGVVRDAFLNEGHDALSCDILPTDRPGPHHQGNVLDILGDGWDLMVAHPPCTYLCNSGVKHLHTDDSRWAKLDEGAAFFKEILEAPIPRIAVENPIMHKYAKTRIGGVQQDQVIQPWQFGHPEQKATCLWLKGLPKLLGTENVKEEMMRLPASQRHRIHWYSGKDRWKVRSVTFPGIATAMGRQWGGVQAGQKQLPIGGEREFEGE